MAKSPTEHSTMPAIISQPIPFTASPFSLAVADLILFLRITIFCWPPTAGLPSIVLPMRPFRSGKLDELYPSAANLWALTLHLFLIVVQSVFVLFWIPSAFVGIPFSYTPLYLGSIVGVFFGNRWFCRLLNGRPRNGRHFQSKVDLSAWPAHPDEKWIFINGVAAGKTWMQSNLDRLALGFRRPIMGIHNETRGIIFDVFECIIQRTFGYATPDIREAYAALVTAISDEQYKKIVLILHSQGAIEGGMALDWLFATVPGAHLARVEVYTFGSAANHFNSPPACKVNAQGKIIHEELDNNGKQRRKIVSHIEHYANAGDYVSRFGILHFRPMPRNNNDNDNYNNSPATQQQQVLSSTTNQQQQQQVENRYVGRLFVRRASGHQMNANYLDNFFTMNNTLTAVEEGNPFMDGELNEDLLDRCEIASVKTDADLWDTRQYTQRQGGAVDQAAAIQGKGEVKGVVKQEQVRRIKDVSRLWQYRNGQSPPVD